MLAFVPSVSALAQEAKGKADPGLAHVQETIVRGFTTTNADLLATTISRRVKTYVASARLAADDGYYGADQVRLLLLRMFRGRETVGFRLLEPEVRPRADGVAVISAVWSYREAGSPPGDIRLSFSVGPESGLWRVREIRDLR